MHDKSRWAQLFHANVTAVPSARPMSNTCGALRRKSKSARTLDEDDALIVVHDVMVGQCLKRLFFSDSWPQELHERRQIRYLFGGWLCLTQE